MKTKTLLSIFALTIVSGLFSQEAAAASTIDLYNKWLDEHTPIYIVKADKAVMALKANNAEIKLDNWEDGSDFIGIEKFDQRLKHPQWKYIGSDMRKATRMELLINGEKTTTIGGNPVLAQSINENEEQRIYNLPSSKNSKHILTYRILKRELPLKIIQIEGGPTTFENHEVIVIEIQNLEKKLVP